MRDKASSLSSVPKVRMETFASRQEIQRATASRSLTGKAHPADGAGGVNSTEQPGTSKFTWVWTRSEPESLWPQRQNSMPKIEFKVALGSAHRTLPEGNRNFSLE